MKKAFYVFCVVLLGCQPVSEKSTTQPETAQGTPPSDGTPQVLAQKEATKPLSSTSLDLTQLATGVPKADPKTYAYPFDTSSEAVKNYAKAYDISPQQAAHAMTILMASPEALNKILDQIGGEYRTHALTDGKEAGLVVYTSGKIVPVAFEYVIADNFGKGLVLPVQVLPKP